MLSSRIRLCATVAPRFAFDCESRSRISIGYVFLPDRMPLLNKFCMTLTVYLFAAPKLASGPVSGATQPILIVRSAAYARVVATYGASPSAAPPTAARLSSRPRPNRSA